MNKVIINGNLTKDLEVRTAGKILVANFTIANNEGFGDKKHTSFINCTMFGEKRIEALQKFLLKGTKVLIEGAWRSGSYEKKDGTKVYTHELTVHNLEIEKFVDIDKPDFTPVTNENTPF